MALNSERPETARSAVPDLSRMSLKQATETLQQKGLTVGVVTKVDSIEAMTGKVVEQRPSGHTQVYAETPTDIAIGRGVNTTFVPNVVGMTAGPAKQMINNAYLVYTEQRGPSADPDKGKIVAQDPEPGKPTTPNSTVTVGTGLTMVTVPKGIVGKAARTSAKRHPEELPPPACAGRPCRPASVDTAKKTVKVTETFVQPAQIVQIPVDIQLPMRHNCVHGYC